MRIEIDTGPAFWAGTLVDWATLFTGAIGVAALVISIKSYLDTSAAARDAHMHGLFREYLHARQDSTSFGGAEDLPETAVSVRLYVLEEMYSWAKAERRLLWIRTWVWRHATRKRLIDAWEETILVHASYDMTAAVENLRDYRQCYGDEFLVFLRDHLNGERVLATWAGQHFRGGRLLADMNSYQLRRFLIQIADDEEEIREVVNSELRRRRVRNILEGHIRSNLARSPEQPDVLLHIPPAARQLLLRLADARVDAGPRLQRRKKLRQWSDSALQRVRLHELKNQDHRHLVEHELATRLPKMRGDQVLSAV